MEEEIKKEVMEQARRKIIEKQAQWKYWQQQRKQ